MKDKHDYYEYQGQVEQLNLGEERIDIRTNGHQCIEAHHYYECPFCMDYCLSPEDEDAFVRLILERQEIRPADRGYLFNPYDDDEMPLEHPDNERGFRSAITVKCSSKICPTVFRVTEKIAPDLQQYETGQSDRQIQDYLGLSSMHSSLDAEVRRTIDPIAEIPNEIFEG